MSNKEEQTQEQPVYTPVVNQIAMYYKGPRKLSFDEDISNETKGKELEEILTEVCDLLSMAGELTQKVVDIDFCLGLVGSYLIAKEMGDVEITETPGDMFKENIFDQLDKREAGEEIVKKEVDDEQDTPDPS